MRIYNIFRREIYFRELCGTRVQIWLVPHHTFRRYRKQHSTHSALLPTATKLFTTLRKFRRYHITRKHIILINHLQISPYTHLANSLQTNCTTLNNSIHKNVNKMLPHVAVAATRNNHQPTTLNTLDFRVTIIRHEEGFHIWFHN
jgi:hypothetical protein